MPVSAPLPGEKERVLEYINELIDNGTLNTNFIEYTIDQQGNTQLMIGGPDWKPHRIGTDNYLIYNPHADLRPHVGMDIDGAGDTHMGGQRKKTRKRAKKGKRKKRRTKRYRRK